MKYTRPAVAGATVAIAVSLIGAVTSAPADAQTRITSVQQLRASIQHAVALEQTQSTTLNSGPAGAPF